MFWLHVRLDRGGTARSCVVNLLHCGSFSRRKMEVKKGLSQSGPACAWITVKFSVSIMVCLTQDGYRTCLEHFVMLEMVQESGESMRRRYKVAGSTCYTKSGTCAGMVPQNPRCQGKPSMWSHSPRRVHMNDYPFSDEESETKKGGSQCQSHRTMIGSSTACSLK